MNRDQPPLSLRLLRHEDLAFADTLRALVGWNQTYEDWERFLALEPDGCFLAECDGAPAGTATTLVYGPDLAWIGMALVHPDYRRRGIGRALLECGLEHLRARGVRCIKLDATPLGKHVYDTLGFKEEWTLTRWVYRQAASPSPVPEQMLRIWRPTDAQQIESLDRTAFGVSRQRLLQPLARQSRCVLVLESEGISGYGMLRSGSQALYLGPVVAQAAVAGIRLLDALVARSEGQTIFLDVPDQNAGATAWAWQHGCTAQRALSRMFLGENLRPGHPNQQFAIAGPESG
jgi:ribosomal protein S18 acetylase RimI-like enzyme